jgi:hypothetical protein
MRELRTAFDVARDLISVALRHADIRENDVRGIRLDPFDGLLAVADGRDLDVFVRECELDDALDRDAVVRQEKLVRHGYGSPITWRATPPPSLVFRPKRTPGIGDARETRDLPLTIENQKLVHKIP